MGQLVAPRVVFGWFGRMVWVQDATDPSYPFPLTYCALKYVFEVRGLLVATACPTGVGCESGGR